MSQAQAVVLVCNENFVPLPQVEVERYSLSSGKALGSAKTNLEGLATFTVPDLEDESFFFRPRITRHSGQGNLTDGAKRLYRLS